MDNPHCDLSYWYFVLLDDPDRHWTMDVLAEVGSNKAWVASRRRSGEYPRAGA